VGQCDPNCGDPLHVDRVPIAPPYDYRLVKTVFCKRCQWRVTGGLSASEAAGTGDEPVDRAIARHPDKQVIDLHEIPF
jgi:hypothetical protein